MVLNKFGPRLQRVTVLVNVRRVLNQLHTKTIRKCLHSLLLLPDTSKTQTESKHYRYIITDNRNATWVEE